jgi:hypothetical protein
MIEKGRMMKRRKIHTPQVGPPADLSPKAQRRRVEALAKEGDLL